MVSVSSKPKPKPTTGAAKVTAASPGGRVPEEVMDLILHHVVCQSTEQRSQNPHYYTGKSGLLSCALVSKFLYKKVLPLLCSTVTFDVSHKESFVKFQKFCRAVILNEELGGYVEELSVVNYGNEGVYEMHIPTFNAFRRLVGLKRVAFVVGGRRRNRGNEDPRGTTEASVEEEGLSSPYCLAENSPFADACKLASNIGIDWASEISLSVRTNLSILFSQPTLTHLTLSGIRNLPFTLLCSLTSIPSLTLGPYLDIDTSDETGLLAQTPMVAPADVHLMNLQLKEGVTPNLVRTLSSILCCKPGVVRRLGLVSDVWDLITPEEQGDEDGTKSENVSDDESVVESRASEDRKKGGNDSGLDDWVTDMDGGREREPKEVSKKPSKHFRIYAPIKQKIKPKEKEVATPHSGFSKAAWLLIEAAGTSLERFEWESSPLIPLSFRPINLTFLRHTLQFLTVTVSYPARPLKTSPSEVLKDVIKLCKPLSAYPDAVLEELVIKCICTTTPHPLQQTLKQNTKSGKLSSSLNSSLTSLIGSDKSHSNGKTVIDSLARHHITTPLNFQHSSDILDEWIELDNVLKTKKALKMLKSVNVEFQFEAGFESPIPGQQRREWASNHSRKIEKRLAGIKAKGVGIQTTVRDVATS